MGGLDDPVLSELDETDSHYLRRSIQISRCSLDAGKTPVGAVLVVNGQIAGEGASSVIQLRDPTAHAEVMALRAAGAARGTHLFETGIMYSSSQPCPMCLTACYWARLSRVVFAATSHDMATAGFEDLRLYRELALHSGERSLRESSAGGDLRELATSVLRDWTDQLPFPVEPKY